MEWTSFYDTKLDWTWFMWRAIACSSQESDCQAHSHTHNLKTNPRHYWCRLPMTHQHFWLNKNQARFFIWRLLGSKWCYGCQHDDTYVESTVTKWGGRIAVVWPSIVQVWLFARQTAACLWPEVCLVTGQLLTGLVNTSYIKNIVGFSMLQD